MPGLFRKKASAVAMTELDISEYELILASADGDPRVLVRVLSGRVARLTIEKEQLERKLDANDELIKSLSKRVEKMETVHKMGAGIAIIIPIIGAAITLLLAKGTVIFKPWFGNGAN